MAFIINFIRVRTFWYLCGKLTAVAELVLSMWTIYCNL